MRFFPVQKFQGTTIPEPVYLLAYEVYKHLYGPQLAMIDFEHGCRGGFSVREIVAFLYARAFPQDEWNMRFEEALRDERVT